jgi:hypothetical protein
MPFSIARRFGAVVMAGAAVTAVHAEQTAPPDALLSRARAYWERRQAKDLAGAYAFYCAGYKGRVSQPQLMQMTRLNRFDLKDISVSATMTGADRAQVTIAYKFMLPTLPGELVDAKATDAWSRDPDGQWCKEDEPLVLPFPTGPQ